MLKREERGRTVLTKGEGCGNIDKLSLEGQEEAAERIAASSRFCKTFLKKCRNPLDIGEER